MQEVIVLVLKCALAIAAVVAIYCLAIVLMNRLSD
ncbi:membrane protein [Escherichia coli]|nr:membrane protein [Escherichia coli]